MARTYFSSRRPPKPVWLLGSWCLAGAAALGCEENGTDQKPVVASADASAPSPRVRITSVPDRLELSAGERERLTLQCSPEGIRPLELSVVPRQGSEPTPAFLSQSNLETNESGRAEVVLTLPAAASDFFVIVKTVGGELSIPVTVTQRATADLAVTTLYDGARPIQEWVIAALPNSPCSESCDLDFNAEPTFPTGQPARLNQIPASGPMSVMVRGEHYACGCQEFEPVPGVLNSVNVIVKDRRLQLNETQLHLQLGFERTLEFAERLEAAFSAIVEAFVTPTETPYTSESDTLLRGMAAGFSDPGVFLDKAWELDWNGILEQYLVQRFSSASPLGAQLDSWLRQGGDGLLQPGSLQAELRGQADGGGSLELRTVVGLPPETVGMPALSKAQLGASGDLLQVGVELTWKPSVLLGALAEQSIQQSGTLTIPRAQSQLIDCGAIGRLLQAPAAGSELDAGTSTKEAGAEESTSKEPALQGCDSVCLADLCAAALEAQWGQAVEVHSVPQTLELALSAVAQLDEWAVPTAFEGRFRGSAEFGDTPVPVQSPTDAGLRPNDAGDVPLELGSRVAVEGTFSATPL